MRTKMGKSSKGSDALLAGTLVYRQDPDLVGQIVGPGLLGPIRLLCCWGLMGN